MTLPRRPAAVLLAGIALVCALSAAPPAAATGSGGPQAPVVGRHRVPLGALHRGVDAPRTGGVGSAADLGTAVSSGTRIEPGQFLSRPVAEEGGPEARAVMQTDGNFVLYGATGIPQFASHTSRHPGAYAVFQTDGNFVVYSPTRTPLWASGTGGTVADTLLLYTDDQFAPGSAVLWLWSWPDDQEGPTFFWDSDVSPQAIPPVVPSVADRLTTGQQIRSDQYLVAGTRARGLLWELTLQRDGNVVVLDGFGNPVWALGTRGRGGVRLVQQSDGNLVLYRADGVGVWASHTSGHPGARLTLQGDGKAVVFGPDNRPLELVGAPPEGYIY